MNHQEDKHIIRNTPEACKMMEDETNKLKIERLETVGLCQQERNTLSFDDPPMLPKSVTPVKRKHKKNHTPLKKVHGENLVGSMIEVWWPADEKYYQGIVESFNCITKRHRVLYCDGDEERLNLKHEQWRFFKNVPTIPDSGQAHPTKVSAPQGRIICVQGYKVKRSFAPILEAIFMKYGDIAANCVFKSASVRSSLLEVVCEVVRRIQTNDIIEEMEEIECQVADTEAANIDVSWLRAHLKVFHKRKEATKNSSLLMEMKANTILVKRAAQKDLRESSAKLMSAKEQFEKAERCVRVLHLVEKNLNNSILESKAEINLPVEQRIL